MPPKKKQKKENGFMVFMKSMKPQLEAKGHRFPRGFPDVIPVCSPLWNVRYLKTYLLWATFRLLIFTGTLK